MLVQFDQSPFFIGVDAMVRGKSGWDIQNVCVEDQCQEVLSKVMHT